MRKPEQQKLDRKYGGVAVSRTQLEDDANDPLAPVEDSEEEDPFAVDGEKSSDKDSEASGMDIEEDHVNGVDEDTADLESGSDEAESLSGASGELAEDDMANSDEDSSVGSDQGSEGSFSGGSDSDDKPSARLSMAARAKAANAKSAFESAVVSSLTASAIDQVRKGVAVQQQQNTYDRLLDSRIKLQKALTTSNQLESGADLDENEIKSAAAKAEAAALSFWSTIDAIRCDIMSHQQPSQSNTKKRKLEPLEPTSKISLATLHAQSEALESVSIPNRESTLNHWYNSTRPSTITSATRSALSTTPTDTISTTLQTYLSSQLPKLTAAAQPSPTTYDDTPFYQPLLTQLITSRTNAASFSSSLPSTALPVANSRGNKIKKNVDTKASKGRKIRYTVHEKLQDFMAPEDRTTWTTRGREEFFGSLFGRTVNGAEHGVDDEAEDEVEEGGLRLFRSAVPA